MRIAILGNSQSSHIISLSNLLSEKGHEIYVISGDNNIEGYALKVNFIKLKFSTPYCYVFSFFELKRILKKINPDLLNTHYATGYGTLSSLCNYFPTILSVWGSDIFDFPWKSKIHFYILRYNLLKPHSIASTSNVMAEQLRKIYNKEIVHITPFGIDVNKFFNSNKIKIGKTIVIGTVKSLHYNYGIDLLIIAFGKLCSDLKDSSIDVKLEITGDGPQLDDLLSLASELRILDKIIFHGKVQHSEVPKYLNRLDIYVALSRHESYGVAILEACSCELPVLVSNAPGPSEVVINDKTGLIVEIDDVDKIVLKLKKLVFSSELRSFLGKNGRQHVLENYDERATIDNLIYAYQNTLNLAKIN